MLTISGAGNQRIRKAFLSINNYLTPLVGPLIDVLVVPGDSHVIKDKSQGSGGACAGVLSSDKNAVGCSVDLSLGGVGSEVAIGLNYAAGIGNLLYIFDLFYFLLFALTILRISESRSLKTPFG